MEIESKPYLSLNCFLELKLNLIIVCLSFQQTCFRVDGLGLLWVTCLLLCVNCGLLIRQETFWVEKLPVMSSLMWKTKLLAVAIFSGTSCYRCPKGYELMGQGNCRHSKEIAEFFPKDAAPSKQMVGLKKTRLGLWDVAPKKVGRELSEKEF